MSQLGATWDDLKSSIVSMFDFNLFGVPVIGADICGFNGNTTEELCARWIEVGAFYPFSRDHNAIGALSQELYRWDSVAEAGRRALSIRYQMLPLLYTLLFKAHKQGSTVVRALWNNFPEDNSVLDINAQFMWGKDVLFSPVLAEGDRQVKAYFPAGVWYSFAETQTGREILDMSQGGGFKLLSTPLTSTNVHVWGGSILPLQDAKMTTTESRTTPFRLLVALSVDGQAEGCLFWDDGEQVVLRHSLEMHFQAVPAAAGNGGELQGKVMQNSLLSKDVISLSDVEIVGHLLLAPTRVLLNGQPVVFSFANSAVKVQNLSLSIGENFSLTWE
jgi:alpha-glucosidase (family GH31 glycosyl hydrolase)